MQRAIIWAVGLAALLPATAGSTTTDTTMTGAPIVAESEQWCGFSVRDKSTIECGYSSIAACESATGKDGSCFVDPEYAQNIAGTTPMSKGRSATRKIDARRS
jgi:hypothetical protein